METPEPFPYEIVAGIPGYRATIKHSSGRLVAHFQTHSKAAMQLERLRLWWEHAHSVPWIELEATITRAVIAALSEVDLSRLVRELQGLRG